MKEVAEDMCCKGIRNNRGGKITFNVLTHMFHNRRYIGEYKYRDIIHTNGIPAIVPLDLFEKVQDRMAQTKKAPAKHKAEDDYLLSPKLYCGKCNRLMVGESGTKRLDHKRRLINTFVNSVYLYDDIIIINFNYKDGAKTVRVDEVKFFISSSDLFSPAGPKIDNLRQKVVDFYLLLLHYSLFTNFLVDFWRSNKNLTKQDEIKDFFVSENLVTRKLAIRTSRNKTKSEISLFRRTLLLASS
ncbi:MAG: recombinase family protein [Clostridia bacterium]|nr:recombinase family protein [Clostridia bacterium]